MSKIGLIAYSLFEANSWRHAASITNEHAVWLESIRDMNGLTFYSLICVPGWELRRGNIRILAEARLHLTRRGVDAEIAAEAATVDAEDVVYPNVEVPLAGAPVNSEPLVPEWETDGLRAMHEARRQAEHEAAFPSLQTTSDSDEAASISLIGPTLYGMMNETQRRALIGFMRMRNEPLTREYIAQLATRYGVDLNASSIDSDTARRAASINAVVRVLGEHMREPLGLISTGQLMRTRPLIQEIDMLPGSGVSPNEIAVAYPVLRDRLEVMVNQSLSPATTPTLPRTPALPFADNFRDVARQERRRAQAERETRSLRPVRRPMIDE